MRNSKYPLFNDSEWLRQKYEIEGVSTNVLSVLAGAPAATTACQALRRHGIKVRTKSEGHLVNREDDGFLIEPFILTGCLLGDCCLKKHNKKSNDCNPIFQKNNIFYDHVLFVGKQLFTFGVEDRIIETDNSGGYKRKSNEPQNIFFLRSLAHTELMPWYRDWYPESNGFKKIIPQNIQINAISLLHWFLDDGYSYIANRAYSNPKYNKSVVRVCFATQSFNRAELDFLSERIKRDIGLTITPRFHQRHGVVKGTGLEMALSENESPAFFEMIGKPPVVSLAYKWKSLGVT